jgi:alanyl-tRNA synthetase
VTVRLYYDDPALLAFEARVTGRREEGGRIAVLLDRTAFYPTSGGQPHDTGRLGEAAVLEVLEAEGGGILHLLDRDPGPGPLQGRVDGERRLDHRQHHTGQHILSRAFEDLIGAATIGFHLGPTGVDIDLDAGALDEETLSRAEALANRIVWENRAVTIHYAAGPEDRARFRLRKETAREGELRIIQVEEFDATPCGGTHCRATGEVGLVKIRRWEKVGSRARVHFLCGGRAVADYGRKNRDLLALAKGFSVEESEVPAAVGRAIEELSSLRRESRALRQALAVREAAELVALAEPAGECRVVASLREGANAEHLSLLAALVRKEPSLAAVLAAEDGDRGELVIVRSDGLRLDVRPILALALEEMAGRGGGRPESARGSGERSGLERALSRARAALVASLQSPPD